jgi:hypothetical protein
MMLGIHSIEEIEVFFLQKKLMIRQTVQMEQSEPVIDFFVKGFLQSIVNKIFQMAPELHAEAFQKFNNGQQMMNTMSGFGTIPR